MKSSEDVVRILSRAPYEAKYTSLEMFLNMERSHEGPELNYRGNNLRRGVFNPVDGNDKELSSPTTDYQVRIVPRWNIDEIAKAPRNFTLYSEGC